MLWCESVAPFGKPVVPDVYWMLIGWSNVEPGLALLRSSLGSTPSARARNASQPSPSSIDSRRPLGVRTPSTSVRVVGALEAGRADEQRAAGLAQRVIELVLRGTTG